MMDSQTNSMGLRLRNRRNLTVDWSIEAERYFPSELQSAVNVDLDTFIIAFSSEIAMYG